MSSRLAARVEKLELAAGGAKPIKYIWIRLDEPIDAAIEKARTQWPHHELRSIRWLRPDEAPHAA